MVVNKIKIIIEEAAKNIKHILLLFFFLGFIVDAITLPGPTSNIGLTLGLIYIVSISTIIILREGLISRYSLSGGATYSKVIGMLSVMLSFILGSLLSYVLIYYTRSSDLMVSGPLILFIIIVVIINEFIKSTSIRMMIDSLLLIIASTFYIIFAVPFVLGSIGDKVFLLSILISTIFALLHISLMHIINSRRIIREGILSWLPHKYYLNLLVAIPSLIGTLYFTNIIPAVPLTLSSSNVYSQVIRDASTGGYKFTGQSIQSYIPFVNPIAVPDANGNLYYYSAVTAPSKLSANVNHSWQKYNTNTKSWDTLSNVSFPIYGGREGGFRGYSVKTNISKGLWRVLVNIGNRHIGSFKFEVK